MTLHPQESRWKRKRRSRTLQLKADFWLCSTRSKGLLRKQRRSPPRQSRPPRVSPWGGGASISKHCILQPLPFYTSKCVRKICSQMETSAPHFPFIWLFKWKFQEEKHLKVTGGSECSQDSRWLSAGVWLIFILLEKQTWWFTELIHYCLLISGKGSTMIQLALSRANF